LSSIKGAIVILIILEVFFPVFLQAVNAALKDAVLKAGIPRS
jgi:hypothetical protein